MGCDLLNGLEPHHDFYFNPRTPCGVRLVCSVLKTLRSARFQSTHPVWGATPEILALWNLQENFNPRTPCGVRHGSGRWQARRQISIHAPRVGCDREDGVILDEGGEISIHAPRVGCDVFPPLQDHDLVISIHAPRVGCDGYKFNFAKAPTVISIHAPRVGCDCPTPLGCPARTISIHAPRVGCDLATPEKLAEMENFNPRTPCGVRRCRSAVPGHSQGDFNPRTPCGVRHPARMSTSWRTS